MADHAGFLNAIRVSPDDDTPRLVYADWLDEQGDPRGEAMRCGVMLARLPEDDPRRTALEQELRHLEERHAGAWLGPLCQRVLRRECSRGLLAVAARAAQLFPLPKESGEV